MWLLTLFHYQCFPCMICNVWLGVIFSCACSLWESLFTLDCNVTLPIVLPLFLPGSSRWVRFWVNILTWINHNDLSMYIKTLWVCTTQAFSYLHSLIFPRRICISCNIKRQHQKNTFMCLKIIFGYASSLLQQVLFL